MNAIFIDLTLTRITCFLFYLNLAELTPYAFNAFCLILKRDFIYQQSTCTVVGPLTTSKVPPARLDDVVN